MAKWIITDSARYIYRDRRGSYVPTFQKDDADVFDTKQKADAVFYNCLPKPLRKVFRVEKIYTSAPVNSINGSTNNSASNSCIKKKVSSGNTNKNNSVNSATNKVNKNNDDNVTLSIKPVTTNDLQENTEKTEDADNIRIWIVKAKQLNNLFAEATVRRKELKKQLSNIDKEIEDILHYLEFTKLNAAQGYKTYKMLKDKRISRRSIKNELEIVNVILEKEPISCIEDEIVKKIQQLDSRKYEPRMMSELFNL